MVMADRALIYSTCLLQMCNLEHATFFARKSAALPQSIASVRIRVERAIEQVKYYRILHGVVPHSLHAQLEMQFGFICSILTCITSVNLVIYIYNIFIIY